MKNHSTLFVCSECDAEVTLLVSPGCPARLHGKPEDCYEAEAPELQTRECPQCGHEFTDFETDCAIEQAAENAYEERLLRAEARAEARAEFIREGGWTWNE